MYNHTCRRWCWRLGLLGLLLTNGGRVSEAIVKPTAANTSQPPMTVHRSPLPDSSRKSASQPSYAKGQLIVKYKESVIQCVHCLLKARIAFRTATTDASDSLDRLDAKYQVKVAHPIFRTEADEAKIQGPKTLAALRQQYQSKLVAITQRFPARSQRTPRNTARISGGGATTRVRVE